MPAGAKRCDALQHCQLVPVPTLPRREEVVYSIMRRLMAAAAAGSDNQAMAGDAEIDALSRRVANSTAGYVARDISALCRQAFLRMLSERNPRDIKTNGVDALAADFVGQSGTCQVDTLPSWSQFAASLQAVRPSQQMEFEGVRPTKRWSDIGGYDTIKQSLQRFMRLATTENSSSLGINPPSGILLYGPSGCGKTAMALAMIGESACNVIYIRGSELFSKYLGETEARLRRLFRAARAAAPCIVFMDEIDSIAAKREWSSVESGGPALRVLSTLLNEMDGVHETRGVIAVGCTNQLDRIDDAIVRPGRFDQLVKVNMPSLQDRVGILQTLGRNSPLNDDVCIDELAQMTEGYSGAGLEQLFREAGLAAMRQNQSADAFSMSDFISAFDRISGA
ncbi:P-loop containing nucleoside triphosphate hydrolase protein [Kickxella alabastrina]|uniref:P-loop containing nucleoside triphosphate hydrolase protein n=1 Tax=Kickxella alabastrina TaxID=61397 RepID=UPI00221FCE9E|nr:P-loop containing nucleoside triphosphate hydrolase protein [Kickxella alabastrina]KAI7834573.1 P-loop containing nucleoside triphosphate hydrolase protein [Kickxella alabastrina]